MKTDTILENFSKLVYKLKELHYMMPSKDMFDTLCRDTLKAMNDSLGTTTAAKEEQATKLKEVEEAVLVTLAQKNPVEVFYDLDKPLNFLQAIAAVEKGHKVFPLYSTYLTYEKAPNKSSLWLEHNLDTNLHNDYPIINLNLYRSKWYILKEGADPRNIPGVFCLHYEHPDVKLYE